MGNCEGIWATESGFRMYVTDKLVFIHLQKTAGSHIVKLLEKTIGGQRVGRHNAASPGLLDSRRVFLGSIRDPWDWYVSLWNYGCDGNGGFHQRLITRSPRFLRHVRHPAGLIRQSLGELQKQTAAWREVYADRSDIGLFRRWLQMVLDPAFRYDLGEGYGESVCGKLAGIYTYRYLKLCCRQSDRLFHRGIATFNDLQAFEQDNCYITHWIGNERLEQDFIEAVTAAGESLSPADIEYIHACRRTNPSSRQKTTREYYDEASLELVREKEALIIRKFGYTR